MSEVEYFKAYLKDNNIEDVDYASYEYEKVDFDNVILGKKTAEISLYDDYIKNGEPLPVVGDYAVLSFENKRCITKNKEIKIVEYSNLSSDIIKKLGLESKEDLKEKYEKDFNEALQEYNLELKSNTLIVVEIFECIYK